VVREKLFTNMCIRIGVDGWLVGCLGDDMSEYPYTIKQSTLFVRLSMFALSAYLLGCLPTLQHSC